MYFWFFPSSTKASYY